MIKKKQRSKTSLGFRFRNRQIAPIRASYAQRGGEQFGGGAHLASGEYSSRGFHVSSISKKARPKKKDEPRGGRPNLRPATPKVRSCVPSKTRPDYPTNSA
jgi:hypothetical protein